MERGGMNDDGHDHPSDRPLFNEMQARIAAIIVDHLGCEAHEVKPEATFVDDLDADSLDVIELTMAFEEEFGVTIPDDEMEHVSTVEDAFKLIEGKIGG
jgi:acyl carrier protein